MQLSFVHAPQENISIYQQEDSARHPRLSECKRDYSRISLLWSRIASIEPDRLRVTTVERNCVNTACTIMLCPWKSSLLVCSRTAKLHREVVSSFGVGSEASCEDSFREKVKGKPIFVERRGVESTIACNGSYFSTQLASGSIRRGHKRNHVASVQVEIIDIDNMEKTHGVGVPRQK